MGANSALGTEVLNLGLISQISTVVMLVLLFVLLRQQTLRRPYFHAWTNAWIALAAALMAVVVRFGVFPVFLGPSVGFGVWARLAALVYQTGKLAFLLLLLQGILLYLKGAQHETLTRWLWLGVAAVAALSAVFAPTPQAVLFVQGVCNLGVYVLCAVMLLVLPVPRRSLGTRVMGVILGATAAIWVVYLLALAPAVVSGGQGFSALGAILNGPNEYLDLIFGMLLAFGMVLVLFEDTRREIDAAHRELRVAHEQLLRESYLDALTGAYNRRAFVEGTGMEHAGGDFGVVVTLDMDNLKAVNDLHGHKHGDALLRYFASVLRRGLRPSDKLYRMGGDEFLIIMPGAVAKTAGARVEEIIATAPALRLEDSGALIDLRASVGAAEFMSVEDIDSAMHAADRAMYAHKHMSRDTPVNVGPVTGLVTGNRTRGARPA